MKKIFCLILVTLFLVSGSGWATPERMPIKSLKQKQKETAAKAVTKNLDLRNVEDPEARKVLKEILNYLELPYKG